MKLRAQPLTPEAYAPFGWVLGTRPEPGRPDYAEWPTVRFWEEHLVDVGPGGELQLLWANYREETPPTSQIELHRLTEQALVPVAGSPLLAVVAPPPPDPTAPDLRLDPRLLQAFYLDGTRGVCMRRGTWHNHRPLAADAAYLMLTRASTTAELTRWAREGGELEETLIVDLDEPLEIEWDVGPRPRA